MLGEGKKKKKPNKTKQSTELLRSALAPNCPDNVIQNSEVVEGIHILQRHNCRGGGLPPSCAVTVGKTNTRTTGNSSFVFPALGSDVCWLGLAGDGHCRGGSLGAGWAGWREKRQQIKMIEKEWSAWKTVSFKYDLPLHLLASSLCGSSSPAKEQLLICMHHHSGHDYCWHDISCIKGSFRRDCVSWIKAVSFYPKENALHQVY